MRSPRTHVILALAIALPLLPRPGLAQQHAGTASTAAAAAGAQPADSTPELPQPESAFGKVMSVMIAALVQQSAHGAQRDAHHGVGQAAPTSATNAPPIQIAVGAAFQDDVAAAARRERAAADKPAQKRDPLALETADARATALTP